MAKFWNDFKAFAMKGNFIDMAIGVVVGGAFGKIVTSMVNDIIMPLIGWAVGGVDFKELKLLLGDGTAEEPSYLYYGNFIQEVLDFFIVALCIFIAVRLVTKLSEKVRKPKEEEAPAPAPKPDDVVLLEEIRDLLKKQK